MLRVLKSIYLSEKLYISLAIIAFLFLLSYWLPALYGIVWLLVLALIVVILTEISLLFKSTAFKASRILPEKFSNSDANYVLLKLQNNHLFKVRVEIIDEIPFQFQKRDFLMNTQLNGNQQKTLTYDLRPVDRGEYFFGHLNCFVSTSIGLIKKKYSFNHNQLVKVYPSFIQMKKYDFLAMDSKLSFAGLKKIRRIGHTMEFEQIKDYISGDDIRSINWKATAKKSHLMVNQFQDEKMQPVYSIIDSGRVMKMPFKGLKLLDYAINSTLAFSNIALKKGDKVGLIQFSNKINSIITAQAKRTYLSTILETLYSLNTHFLDSDFGLLQATIKRNITHRSLIMLYTNFEHISSLHRQMKYLQAIAKKHVLVVIFFENTELARLADKNAENITEIYESTIAQQFQQDKKLIVKELQQKGIQTVLTAPEELTLKTINKYLEIKARGLI